MKECKVPLLVQFSSKFRTYLQHLLRPDLPNVKVSVVAVVNPGTGVILLTKESVKLCECTRERMMSSSRINTADITPGG